MEDWIRDIVERAVSSLRRLASETAQKLVDVWRQITGILSHVGSSWWYYYDRVRWFVDGISYTVGSMWTWAWHLVYVKLPAHLRSTLDSAVRYAADLFNRLRAEAHSLVNNALRWTSDRLGALNAFIGRVRDWAWSYIGPLLSKVDWILPLVRDLLTSPTRLATWAGSAIWEWTWRYLSSNSQRFIANMFRRRQAAERYALMWIEELIARLL